MDYDNGPNHNAVYISCSQANKSRTSFGFNLYCTQFPYFNKSLHYVMPASLRTSWLPPLFRASTLRPPLLKRLNYTRKVKIVGNEQNLAYKLISFIQDQAFQRPENIVFSALRNWDSRSSNIQLNVSFCSGFYWICSKNIIIIINYKTPFCV